MILIRENRWFPVKMFPFSPIHWILMIINDGYMDHIRIELSLFHANIKYQPSMMNRMDEPINQISTINIYDMDEINALVDWFKGKSTICSWFLSSNNIKYPPVN